MKKIHGMLTHFGAFLLGSFLSSFFVYAMAERRFVSAQSDLINRIWEDDYKPLVNQIEQIEKRIKKWEKASQTEK